MLCAVAGPGPPSCPLCPHVRLASEGKLFPRSSRAGERREREAADRENATYGCGLPVGMPPGRHLVEGGAGCAPGDRSWCAFRAEKCSNPSSLRTNRFYLPSTGSESLKLALVAPGRTPISIVNNEISKRKSPVAVSFINGERALGEEAHALGVRYPDRVLYRTRDILGKPADSPEVAALLASSYLPYDIKADPQRKTAVFNVDGMSLSAEEVMASVLHYAKLLAEAATTGEIKDVVIAVPVYFSQAQRQALYDAATVAGLNVMSLINEHVAAAIQYGIERDFTNRTEQIVRNQYRPQIAKSGDCLAQIPPRLLSMVSESSAHLGMTSLSTVVSSAQVLYDFGAGSTTATLLEYSSWKAKEMGKMKYHGQFEVKSVKWDATAGADALDLAICGATPKWLRPRRKPFAHPRIACSTSIAI